MRDKISRILQKTRPTRIADSTQFRAQAESRLPWPVGKDTKVSGPVKKYFIIVDYR